MKKTMVLIILALFFCSHSSLFSQNVRSFGFKFGQARTNQIWTFFEVTDPTKKTRAGISAGAFVEFTALPLLTVNLEGHYIQKGFSVENQNTGKIDSPRIDYITIPLLARFQFTERIESYVLAGPRLDFKINSGNSEFSSIFDEFQYLDYGWTLGAGFELPSVLSTKLIFEIRYSPSITKAFSNGLAAAENESMELLMGVAF